MKHFKLYVRVLTAITVFILPIKSYGQTPVVHDPVNNTVLSAMQAIQKSGFMDLYKGITEVVKVGQDVIEVASVIVDVYRTSEEMVVSAQKLVQIYEVYFGGIVYISNNILYLTKGETDYLIKMLDACAFRYKGEQVDRPRTPSDLAGGKLKETMDLLLGAKKGANISIYEINKLIQELSKEINKTYSDTLNGLTYVTCSVEIKKRAMGVYKIEDFIKEKTNR